MARNFPAYELRPQQIDMLRSIAQAFNGGGHLLVEAGTGTGKSLAYLLPAIEFAIENKTRVVVATNTINLQDQLFHKDLPALGCRPGRSGRPISARAPGAAAGRPSGRRARHAADDRAPDAEPEAAVPRGACSRAAATISACAAGRLSASRRPASMDEMRTLVKVLIWLPTTRTGDRNELLLVNTEPQAWSKIAVSEEGCPLHECVYNQKGLCFFYRARVTAEAAHVLVVNHALLLADIATGNRVLPPYKHLIIDEAHHLEDEATEQLGYQVTQARFAGVDARLEPAQRRPL